MNTASSGRSAGLRQLAAARADIARHLAAVDRNLDRALRERSHAVALVLPRRRAAARARAHLRAIDRALTGLHDLEGLPSRDLPVELIASAQFHIDVLGRALSSVPSYEAPNDRSETRGWLRLLGRELGLDAGLHVRFTDSCDDLRSRVHELGATTDRLLARLHELLTGGGSS